MRAAMEPPAEKVTNFGDEKLGDRHRDAAKVAKERLTEFGGSIAAWLEITLIHFQITMLRAAARMAHGARIFELIFSALTEVKIGVKAVGNRVALIKGLPGLMGKSEAEMRTSTSVSDAAITEAMQ